MSNLSQFFGGSGGGVPIGGSLLAFNGPVSITEGGKEYLANGNVKAYDASYAASIAQAPQLRVFGTPANSYYTSTFTGPYPTTVSYSNGKYATGRPSGGTGYVGTTLALLAAGGTNSFINPGSGAFDYPLYSATHVVITGGANTAPSYSTDGGTTSAGNVGGSFATCPAKTAGIFANGTWLMLSTLQAIAGEQSYIINANPSGAWTVGATTNIGMTSVKSISYGAGVFVAVGVSSSATTGKIATTATAGTAWTDRTAASGVPFLASEAGIASVFSGTNHVVLYGTGTSTTKVMTSPDGINWTAAILPFACSRVVSDGAGTVVAYLGVSAVSTTLSTGVSFALSTDNGATWTIGNVFKGTCPVIGSAEKRIWYVNGTWLVWHASDPRNFVNLGPTLVTPNYIGQQTTLPDDVLTGSGYYVRIK